MATKMTLEQLQQQMEAAKKAFEEARDSERNAALPEIVAKIKLYNFTPEDLGFPARATASKAPGVSIPAGTVLTLNGETWKGGTKGPKPAWLREFLANGGDWNTIVAAAQ